MPDNTQMKILFLGPACQRIEEHLSQLGHSVCREEEPLSLSFIRENHFDFAISYRYRHILPRDIIQTFSNRIINLHISLLPWNRGSDPNLWSFLENTPKGVTIHRINAGIDTGDILLQQEIRFDSKTETLRTAYETLLETIECLFLKNTDALLTNIIPGKVQPSGGSTHRSKDKTPYLHLLEKDWWDTPVHLLAGQAMRERERERERTDAASRKARG